MIANFRGAFLGETGETGHLWCVKNPRSNEWLIVLNHIFFLYEKTSECFKQRKCQSFISSNYTYIYISVVFVGIKHMKFPCFQSHLVDTNFSQSQVLTWSEGPAIGGAFHVGVEAPPAMCFHGGLDDFSSDESRSWLYYIYFNNDLLI